MPEKMPHHILLEHFDWSLRRLEEALGKTATDYYRDAALERFSLTFDRAMQCLRRFAAARGETCDTTTECITAATRLQWIDDPSVWSDLHTAYNQLKSAEKNQHAPTIYNTLPRYYRQLQSLHQKLSAGQ